MAEAVPERIARKSVGELRYDVEIPQQHAIERPGRSYQSWAILCEDDLFNQRIDRGILDANRVSRGGLIGGLRSPEFPLLVAGRQRFSPLVDDHVEIEAAKPVLVLRVVDDADRGRHTDALQRGLVEQRDPFRGRILNQDLDGDRLARGIYQLAIAYLEARFLQELYALPQVGAHSFGIAADRIDVRRGENVGRHLIADRLENFQLQPLGQAGCGKLGSLEIAVDALVLPIEQLLVHLLEIVGVVERPAQPRVLELVAAQIENEALHPAGIVDREFFPDHALFRNRRKIIGRRPLLRRILGDPVGLIGLERFQRDQIVPEEFEAHFVKIVLDDPYRQARAPIVLHPLQLDRSAGNKFLDTVGAGAQWFLQRRCRDVALAAFAVGTLPIIFRQYRQLTDDGRQFAISGRVEREFYIALAGLFGFHDVTIIGAVHRTVLLQHADRENHIIWRHRLAVVPARLLAKTIGHPPKVIGMRRRLGEQAIF